MGQDTDVFIVGGGPAGLAAAIAARERGFRVIVADGAKPPITKACGEGLLPDAVAALDKLGVELREMDGYALRGIRFEDERFVGERPFSRRARARSAARTFAPKNAGAS